MSKLAMICTREDNAVVEITLSRDAGYNDAKRKPLLQLRQRRGLVFICHQDNMEVSLRGDDQRVAKALFKKVSDLFKEK